MRVGTAYRLNRDPRRAVTARPDRPRSASPAPARPLPAGNHAISGLLAGHALPAGVAAGVAAALADRGAPVRPALAQALAGRFGPDVVAQARLHTGPAARRSAAALDAKAYTVGAHIVLGEGHDHLDTEHGRRTLAHELAHVGQQTPGGRQEPPAAERLRVADPAGDAEQAARVAAADSSHPAPAVTLAPDVLTRDRDGPPDESRQARERRDRRRDPTSDLESDWAGEMILGQYLYGGGKPVDLYDDPAWTRYMMHSHLLRTQLQPKVRQLAARLLAHREDGTFPVADQFHAEVENGEGIVGYQYLHGTNKTVHDFQVVGWAKVEHVYGHTEAGTGREVKPGTMVRMDLRYVWNDIIDPNGTYWTDRVKSAIATTITLGGADSYRISISWGAPCTVWFPEQAPAVLTGYPADEIPATAEPATP